MNDNAVRRREAWPIVGLPRRPDTSEWTSTVPLDFGAWLSELVKRVDLQEQEIAELKERLSKLEPIEAPLTPAQMCERHKFKPGTVRDWLFHRTTNGLEDCGAVVTKGRRLYLYEAPFLSWLRDTKPADRRQVGR